MIVMEITNNILSSDDPFDYAGKDASVFSLTNGRLGVRGVLEETGEQAGAILYAGFYDREAICYGERQYGYPAYNEFSAYAPNGLGLRLFYQGEELCASKVHLSQFQKQLRMDRAAFSHHYLAECPDGTTLWVEMERCVPLTQKGLLIITCRVSGCSPDGELMVRSSLTAGEESAVDPNDPRKSSISQNVKDEISSDGQRLLFRKTLEQSGKSVMAVSLCKSNGRFAGIQTMHRGISALYEFKGDVCLTKYVAYDPDPSSALQELERACALPLDELFCQHARELERRWQSVDLAVQDDIMFPLVQYSILQLLLSAPSGARNSIPAKGLSGNGYSGHVFWDTEMYLFPFYLFHFPNVAKQILLFRFYTLPQARRRAQELSYRGALYPWRTISGEECSAFFPAGTAAFHINGDIAYAINEYLLATGDMDFLQEGGLEVLLETARFWLSAGTFSGDGYFHINMVTGPDEYSAMVNDNLYTNCVAKHNFLWSLQWLDQLRVLDPAAYSEFIIRHKISSDELHAFQQAADCMMICRKNDLLLQDANILNREELSISDIPSDHFPLLMHYHPLRLYQTRICKQADAVMAMMLFPDLFTWKEKETSFPFYQRITVHDSSLSKGVFAIVSLDLEQTTELNDFIQSALHLDIDDLHHNTADGLHFANMGLVWMILVRGFLGFRFYIDGLPSFYPKFSQLSFGFRLKLQLQGRTVQVGLSSQCFRIALVKGTSIPLRIFEKKYILNHTPIQIWG